MLLELMLFDFTGVLLAKMVEYERAVQMFENFQWRRDLVRDGDDVEQTQRHRFGNASGDEF